MAFRLRGRCDLSAPRLRFGVTVAAYPDGMPAAEWWWTFAERAEALGFDSLWSGEHVLFHTETASAAVLLAGFAARTRRIAIGTAIYLLPLHPPVLAAKELATLDHVAGGRLIAGIGVGGEYAAEFAAVGVPVTERGVRTDEALEVMRRLWREDGVSHAGRHVRLDDVTLRPRPLQPGGPPIWVAGRSDAALRRAARVGDGYFPYILTAARYRSNSERLDTLCAEYGRDPSAVERALIVYASVANDHETALRSAGAELTRIYRQPFDEVVKRYGVVGAPDDCAARIDELRAAGVRHVVVNWACRQEEILEQMERLATEVLPLVTPR